MKVCNGNIWWFKNDGAICIPTNGYIQRNGNGVLGAGLALEAKNMYPELSYNLGDHLKHQGNIVGWILNKPIHIFSIPVKPSFLKLNSIDQKDQLIQSVKNQYSLGDIVPGFHCKADLSLIEESLIGLVSLLKYSGLPNAFIPLLGCGLGGLSAKKDLFPLLEKLNLPDSITLVYKKE